MKFHFPKIKDGLITRMTITPTGAIKYLTIESYADEIDLTGLTLDNCAEITVNRIHQWPDTWEGAP